MARQLKFLSVGLHGVAAFAELLKHAPDLQTAFVRQELWRFTKRVRSKTVKRFLKGRPGIKWRGPVKEGQKGSGNVKALGRKIARKVTGGDGIEPLEARVKISRLLNVHEQGATIEAKAGGWLYIRDPQQRGKIVARVKSVKIKKRLGFKGIFESEAAGAKTKVLSAMERASLVLEKRANKKMLKNIRGLGFGASVT